MDLFEQLENKPKNLLPYDGLVNYYGVVMSRANADEFFNALMHEIKFQNDQAVIMGKAIKTKRKVAWYGDQAFAYTYSNVTKVALPWTPNLLALKALAERESGASYNACLVNLYHDGSEGMAWHSDSEKDLKQNGVISSLSLGAERKFVFKHKHSKETVSTVLQHGSLLVMKGNTQSFWLHRLPPTKTVHQARINLTFRQIATGQNS